jgi:hypothetical protein
MPQPSANHQGGPLPLQNEVLRASMVYSPWMHGPSAAAMSWRSSANRSRRVSYTLNLAGVLDLAILAGLATWGQPPNL